MARRSRSQRRSRRQRELRPALRGGINASPVILPEADYVSLGEWAVGRFGESGAGLFAQGDVFYDFSELAHMGDPYRAGERLWIFRPVPDEPAESIVLDVVHKAERFCVVDKPHGIATIPRGRFVARTVTVAARRQFGNDDVAAAHRLDAETAGLVLLTGEPRWRGSYQDLFAKRAVFRAYYAVAPATDLAELASPGALASTGALADPGSLAARDARGVAEGQGEARSGAGIIAGAKAGASDGAGVRTETWAGAAAGVSARVAYGDYGAGWLTVDLRIEREPGAIAVRITPGEPNARTHIRLVRELDAQGHGGNGLALYELHPVSGRLHQLRATMNHIGAPIAGDPLYPQVLTLEATAARELPTQLLAARLAFTDPIDGARVEVSSRRSLALAEN